MPLILPEGMGKKIPAGSDLMFEMHYTPNGTAQTDRSTMGMIFAKEAPKYWVLTQGVANDDFRIGPGESNYEVEQWYRFPQDGYLINFMPHMHLRGKDFKYTVHYPDGTDGANGLYRVGEEKTGTPVAAHRLSPRRWRTGRRSDIADGPAVAADARSLHDVPGHRRLTATEAPRKRRPPATRADGP